LALASTTDGPALGFDVDRQEEKKEKGKRKTGTVWHHHKLIRWSFFFVLFLEVITI